MLRLCFRATSDPNLIVEVPHKAGLDTLISLFHSLAAAAGTSVELVSLAGIAATDGLKSFVLKSDANSRQPRMRWQNDQGWRVTWSATPEAWTECAELVEGLTLGSFQFLCYDASEFGVAVCYGQNCRTHWAD